MMNLFWYACFILLLISSHEADSCMEFEDNVVVVILEDELDVYQCHANVIDPHSDINWYESDKKTLISMDQNSRVHQHRNLLWFVSATTEDSGYYYCVKRNLTHCSIWKIQVAILKKNPGMCYNEKAEFQQKLPLGYSGYVVCPHVHHFEDVNKNLPKIQWYKDCKPSSDKRYKDGNGKDLYIEDVQKVDQGHYTCHISYSYMGKHYNITREINLKIIGSGKKNVPVILEPENKTMEVELGSQLVLTCDYKGPRNSMQYWTWNGTYIDDEFNITSYLPDQNFSDPKTVRMISRLHILKVESKYYLHPFFCWVLYGPDKDVTYIALIPPASDLRMFLIGGFITLALVVTLSMFLYKFFKIEIVLLYRDSCYPYFLKKASDGKVYDAYILYPKNFEEGSTYISDIFVFKILPEVLENQCGYNLFIYGRDDLVGEDAIMVANENILKSRRLIIVLAGESSNYNWLGHTTEQQLAMYNALVQDGIKIIMVELEKIKNYENMPESINYLKQKYGVIRWSGDFMEESPSAKTKFWKCVRYHMPAQHHLSSSTRESLTQDSVLNYKKK